MNLFTLLYLIPIAGLYLRLTGCWGDPQAMLGTGMLIAGIPIHFLNGKQREGEGEAVDGSPEGDPEDPEADSEG